MGWTFQEDDESTCVCVGGVESLFGKPGWIDYSKHIRIWRETGLDKIQGSDEDPVLDSSVSRNSRRNLTVSPQG